MLRFEFLNFRILNLSFECLHFLCHESYVTCLSLYSIQNYENVFPWKNILPYLTQIEDMTTSARRKLAKESKQVDGFFQDALRRNCFDAFE